MKHDIDIKNTIKILNNLSNYSCEDVTKGSELRYLSHHMFAIDESFEPTNCCTLRQREDVLGLDGRRAQVGVLLENDDLRRRRNNPVNSAAGLHPDAFRVSFSLT